jgi:hypothetical protein
VENGLLNSVLFFFILFNLVILDEPNVDSNPKALNTVRVMSGKIKE